MIKSWILLNTSAPAYAGVIELCKAEHKELFPKNELSIRLSNDGTLALVKVCTESSTFLGTISGSVLEDIFTEETHNDVIELMCTPEWTVDEEGNNGN
jgi:hypothetical protein